LTLAVVMYRKAFLNFVQLERNTKAPQTTIAVTTCW